MVPNTPSSSPSSAPNLSKPAQHRLAWLFWHDRDTILMNPNIPLEIFLPPPETELGANLTGSHVHLIVTNDRHGLNNAPLLPKHHPRLPNAGSTLTHPLLPPPPPSAPSAARTGSLLMHFASNRDGKRPERMAQWQRIAASPRNEWNKALNSTRYVSEMDEFWRGLGEGEDEGCVVNDIGGRK
ncbi:glycosyltransferase family 34 protein [Bipolaris maydis]|nr:glycosyltransferase family 34 protein [Bipolaris maydis]